MNKLAPRGGMDKLALSMFPAKRHGQASLSVPPQPTIGSTHRSWCTPTY